MEQERFATETVMTAGEFLRFHETVLRRSRAGKMSYLFAFLMFGAIAVFCLLRLPPLSVIVPVAGFILFPFIQRAQVRRWIRQEWKKKPRIHDLKTRFVFYDGHFEVSNRYEKAEVPYERLREIRETEAGLYLMTGEISGMVIARADCPEGLAEFLKKAIRAS